MSQQPSTLGSTISSTDLPTFAAYAGMAIAIVGSLAPWATSPISSASGISGDGKWTALLAVCGIVAIYRRTRWGAGIAAGLLFVFGVGAAVHIHNVVAKVTYLGTQIDHVGWGVYAVCVGAVVTLVALWLSR